MLSHLGPSVPPNLLTETAHFSFSFFPILSSHLGIKRHPSRALVTLRLQCNNLPLLKLILLIKLASLLFKLMESEVYVCVCVCVYTSAFTSRFIFQPQDSVNTQRTSSVLVRDLKFACTLTTGYHGHTCWCLGSIMGTTVSILTDKNFLFDAVMVNFKCLLHSALAPTYLVEY